jgi:hypothetical protein
MKTTLIILISILSIGVYFQQDNFVTSKNDIISKSDSNTDFECRLIVNKTVFKVGEMPEFKVEIKNLTSNDVYLIGSLDASEEKWRMPHSYFTIEKPFKESNSLIGRCGNMNTLRPEDFKLVKPNEVFDPYTNIDDYGYFSSFKISNPENFSKPGKYKIQFHYSTKSNDIKDFMGDDYQTDKKKLKDLLERVPKIELSSNVIEIEIVE